MTECADYNMVNIDSFKLFVYPVSDRIKDNIHNGYIHSLILNTNNNYYKTFQFASFINDPRRNFFDNAAVKEEDMKFWNIDFVVYYVNGWPRIFMITRRDIKANEELMAHYNGVNNDPSHTFWKGQILRELAHFKYKLRRICLGLDIMPCPEAIQHGLQLQPKLEQKEEYASDCIILDDTSITEADLISDLDEDGDQDFVMDYAALHDFDPFENINGNEIDNNDQSHNHNKAKGANDQRHNHNHNHNINNNHNDDIKTNIATVIDTGDVGESKADNKKMRQLMDIDEDEDSDMITIKNESSSCEKFRRYFDAPSKTYYYHNIKTDVSQWQPPDEGAIIYKEDTDQVIKVEKLPEGWIQCEDPTDGCPFYYNHITKKSQWVKPTKAAKNIVDDNKDNNHNDDNNDNGLPQLEEDYEGCDETMKKALGASVTSYNQEILKRNAGQELNGQEDKENMRKKKEDKRDDDDDIVMDDIQRQKKRLNSKLEEDADEEEVEKELSRIKSKRPQTINKDAEKNDAVQENRNKDEDDDLGMFPDPILPSPPEPSINDSESQGGAAVSEPSLMRNNMGSRVDEVVSINVNDNVGGDSNNNNDDNNNNDNNDKSNNSDSKPVPIISGLIITQKDTKIKIEKQKKKKKESDNKIKKEENKQTKQKKRKPLFTLSISEPDNIQVIEKEKLKQKPSN